VPVNDAQLVKLIKSNCDYEYLPTASVMVYIPQPQGRIHFPGYLPQQ